MSKEGRKNQDMGAGITQHQPESNTMKFYEQVQKSAAYDERGNPKSVGNQSAHPNMGGAGQMGGDPTKGMMHAEGDGTVGKWNQGDKQVVSKKLAEKNPGPKKGKK